MTSLHFQDVDVCKHTSVLFYGLLSRLHHLCKRIVHSRGKGGGAVSDVAVCAPPPPHHLLCSKLHQVHDPIHLNFNRLFLSRFIKVKVLLKLKMYFHK
jgi:hypothetical protein